MFCPRRPGNSQSGVPGSEEIPGFLLLPRSATVEQLAGRELIQEVFSSVLAAGDCMFRDLLGAE